MIAVVMCALLLAGGDELHRPLPRHAIGPEPTRQHVDLGPIVLPAKVKNKEQLGRYLQQEADRLGADGFFVVGAQNARPRDPNGTRLPFGPSDGAGGIFVAVAAIAELAQYSNRTSITEDSVLHAFTFRELSSDTRAALSAISNDVITGRISIAEFEMRRIELLAAAKD